MNPVLKIEKLTKSFGGLTAVNGFALELAEHEIHGIIGPNGAGKTTVFNLITGVYRPDSGHILLEEKEIANLPPDVISRSGIARTFQNIRLFSQMSVLDNIKVALHQRSNYRLWDVILGLKRFRSQEKVIAKESLEYLEYFGLTNRHNEVAGSLSYGEQRRLEIARALATHPKVLLLDEPAAGMNPREVEDLISFIRKIHHDFGLAILIIEHQMPVIMDLCTHVQVVDFGQTIAAGDPETVTNDPLVIRAYLGEEEVEEHEASGN
ncbi:MAG: amino acid/amide transporter ATP-binding protein 1, family [Firmicutes bacterium]|nr:amino acid/amide transporter ATP-binding protein 1, family [Bacillota bacterium]